MWCNNEFVQQGYGEIVLPDDSEDSDSSQESEQSSQGSHSSDEMDSDQEEMEQIDPWDRIQHEASKRHQSRFLDLVNEYKQNGDSTEVARIKADNAGAPNGSVVSVNICSVEGNSAGIFVSKVSLGILVIKVK